MVWKWVVLVAIVCVVWFGFKNLADRRSNRAVENRKSRRRRKAESIEDTSQCHVCETYVTGAPSHCGRDNCPYGTA